MLAWVFPSLFIVYLAYWIGASLFGPRYYYEGLFSLTLVSAAGIAWLAGWPVMPGRRLALGSNWVRLRTTVVGLLLIGLGLYNLVVFMPSRLGQLFGMYNVTTAHMAPFLTPSAQELTPALIIVHPKEDWIEYGTLIELEDPYLTTPFIFVHTRGPETDAFVASRFPERSVYHYYASDPYTFYTGPLPP